MSSVQVFRYKADRLPVALVVLLFALDLWVYFSASSLTPILCWIPFSFLVKCFFAAWNHHHQHVNTFRQVWLNRLLEIIYTFHTGVSTNVWVLHHNLGHHLNYLDQSKDESGWMRSDGKTMGVLEYTFVIAATGYYRAIRVGKKYPKFQSGLVGMGVVNLLILAVLCYFNPRNAVLVFALPMFLVYVGTCWRTYHHHSGLETEDHLHASRNTTNKYYNILSGNLGYHTAHHMKQGLHWSKLPEYHKTIEDQIPPELITDGFPLITAIVARLRGEKENTAGERMPIEVAAVSVNTPSPSSALEVTIPESPVAPNVETGYLH